MDKLAQLKEYMEAEKYEAAVALLPDIKENKAKTAPEMMLLARAYGKCADFDHAERLFKKAYKIRPSKLLFRDMIEICIECGRTDEAENYYEHYKEVASSDAFNLSVYKYRIEKKKGSDKAVLIDCLKEITSQEYTPEWAYELAKIYHKAGMKDECVAELERIVSEFDEETGVVIKAKTLIAYYHGEITAEEIVAKGKQREIPKEVPKPVAAQAPRQEAPAEKKPEQPADERPKQPESKPESKPELRKRKRRGLFGFGHDDSDDDEESWGVSAPSEKADRPEKAEKSETPGKADNKEKGIKVSETPECVEGENTSAGSDSNESNSAGYADTDDDLVRYDSAEDNDTEPDIQETVPAEKAETEEAEPVPTPEADNDEEREEIRKTAEAELSLELEEEEEDNKVRLPRVPKEEIFMPHVILSQEDLRDSKAKRIIINKEIRPEDICKNFFRIGEVRRQIFKSMDLVINERKRIFLCVTGEPHTGRSTFAARMVRLYHRLELLKNDFLAGTDAKVLNRLPEGTVTKMLADYSILIENAGELSEKCIAELIKAADERKSGTCVVLEDTSRNINSLLRGGNDLRALINNRIHLPKYDTVDLIGFAYDIAAEGQYMLSVKAAKKLKDGLEGKKTAEQDRFMTVINVMHAAVDSADERFAPLILKMAAEAAFDDEGRLVITESDITL